METFHVDLSLMPIVINRIFYNRHGKTLNEPRPQRRILESSLKARA